MSRPAAPKLATVALGLTAFIAAFAVFDYLFFVDGAALTREGGGIENVSAILYVFAVITFFAMIPSEVWRPLFHIPVLLLLFGLRELDLDKAFTRHGILTAKFYSGDAALWIKLAGGGVAVFALFILYRLLRSGVPAMWRGLRARETWSWFALLAGGLTVGTKLSDGLARKLAETGIAISDELDLFATTAEEIGEAFIPVCAILAIVSRWKGRSP